MKDMMRAVLALPCPLATETCAAKRPQGRALGQAEMRYLPCVMAFFCRWIAGIMEILKIERQNAVLKELVEIREEVGIYLNAPLLRGWHGNVEVRARSRLKRSSNVTGFGVSRLGLFAPDQTRCQSGAHHNDHGAAHHPMGDQLV